MRIANIFPIANQRLYKNEKYTMILAHLVQKGLYIREFFNSKSQYTIMDNGLFEKAQVSTNVLKCIEIAENSGIYVDEIIIPDSINDAKVTMELFMQNMNGIIQHNRKYRFMYVAQATTYEELAQQIQFISRYVGMSLSVGISKLTPLDRADPRAIEIYKRCPFPIHFLGIKSTLNEILPVRHIIRGCDTSQIPFMAKNLSRCCDSVFELCSRR